MRAEVFLLDELRKRIHEMTVPEGDRLYPSVDALLLAHGRWFEPAPLPVGVQRLPARQCFENAFLLASTRPDLTYVEGYVVDEVGLYLLHAWCSDPDGNAVDPTWPEPGLAYLGVPLGPGQGTPARGPGMLYDIAQLIPVLGEGLLDTELVDVGRPIQITA
ncbi:hypothetical protein ACF06W_11775 [Streptomyces albus]|uniref:hypothetical protein n=1 Tax=Streptomyces albus TaxID=1888 RepID=UPI0037014BF7